MAGQKSSSINKENEKEISDIVAACEYWAHQKRQSQKMISLADETLSDLEKRLKELTGKEVA